MHSSVETLTDNRVKLTVELDEAEFETEVEAAFKRIAREVRVPGFRPGRAPRRLLEAQMGPAAGRAEALRASLPDYYARAVVEHDIDVIDAPRIEVTEGSESGPVRFDAVVDVRPAVLVSGYDDLSVQIPNPTVGEEEIQDEIDDFRRQFAELSTVSRAAVDGDHLTIDIAGTLGGETIDGLTTSDYDYCLGTGAVVPEIDENLRGASAGDILEFSASHPDPDEDRRLSFRVLVKEVQQVVLPDFDDGFVAAYTEHDTAEDFRAALETLRARARVLHAESVRREAIAEAVAALVTDEVPASMVESEIEARFDALRDDLERRGYELDDYLDSIGQSHDEFEAGVRAGADRSVKLDLALRAVAAAEGLEADSAAVDTDLRRLVGADADDAGEGAAAEVERLHDALASSGQLSGMRSQISKRTALEWITERVELVDPDGEVVDPELLTLPADVGEDAESPQDVGTEQARDEQARDEQARDEQARDEQARDEQARDEQARDEQQDGL